MTGGNNEYMALLREMQDTRKECAEGHRDTMQAMADIRGNQKVFVSDIKAINRQLADITVELKPLIVSSALQDRDLREAEGDVQRIYTMISADRAEGRGSFWTTPNAKYAFVMGIIVLTGLFALAGYNVNLKDVMQ